MPQSQAIYMRKPNSFLPSQELGYILSRNASFKFFIKSMPLVHFMRKNSLS